MAKPPAQPANSYNADPENSIGPDAAQGFQGPSGRDASSNPKIDIPPFVGRLGGNGAATVTRCSTNEDLLKSVPDAAPLMSLRETFSLQPFLTVGLWKSALMEGMGRNTSQLPRMDV
jgi:hypothetical protein